MRWFAGIALTTMTLAGAAPVLDGAEPAPPNIVLILADDLGWSDLGCYGSEIPTPHIDSLARQGLRFTQFYNNAVCGPTRASLLTGLFCQQIGHSGAHWNQPTDFSRCVTIAEVLRSAGYRTLMVGKWQERDLPSRRGFDRFFGPMCQGKISYYHEVQGNPYYLDDEPWAVPAQGFYMTDALTDHAVRFVEEATQHRAGSQRRPFFLYAAYVAPHWPLHAPESQMAPHRPRYRDKGWDDWRNLRYQRQRAEKLVPEALQPASWPEAVRPWADDPHKTWQAERMAVYAAQVAAMDRGVGRILDAVRKAGQEDNTLVMFLSDNGAAPDGGLAPSSAGFGFGPKRRNDTWRRDGVAIRPGSGPDNLPGPADTFAAYGLAWAAVSNTPWRGTKMTGYEGGIRTHLVVRWPKVITRGGQVTHQAGHVIDLMATCADVSAAEYPREFQGRRPLPLEGKSLVPIFRGEQRAGHEMLGWRVPEHCVLRAGPWKLIRGSPKAPWELYDLVADGVEAKNLARQLPGVVAALEVKWQQWAARCGVKP